MNLKQIRIKHNLTQSEVAKQIGLRDTAISNYESGKREPNIATLKKLASIFNCSVDDLIK